MGEEHNDECLQENMAHNIVDLGQLQPMYRWYISMEEALESVELRANLRSLESSYNID